MPYWYAVDPKLHVGYRKGKTGGKWVARWYIGERSYESETLNGIADDHQDADGSNVLSFAQAQERARELVKAKLAPPAPAAILTVQAACLAYVEFLKAERKTGEETGARLKKHVYPDAPAPDQFPIGDRIVAELSQEDVEKWKRAMVRKDAEDPETERRSKDTANRVLSMLRAALNMAFNDPANNIASDVAWRRVKPFRDVGRARQVHLEPPECKRAHECHGWRVPLPDHGSVADRRSAAP